MNIFTLNLMSTFNQRDFFPVVYLGILQLLLHLSTEHEVLAVSVIPHWSDPARKPFSSCFLV